MYGSLHMLYGRHTSDVRKVSSQGNCVCCNAVVCAVGAKLHGHGEIVARIRTCVCGAGGNKQYKQTNILMKQQQKIQQQNQTTCAGGAGDGQSDFRTRQIFSPHLVGLSDYPRGPSFNN